MEMEKQVKGKCIVCGREADMFVYDNLNIGFCGDHRDSIVSLYLTYLIYMGRTYGNTFYDSTDFIMLKLYNTCKENGIETKYLLGDKA